MRRKQRKVKRLAAARSRAQETSGLSHQCSATELQQLDNYLTILVYFLVPRSLPDFISLHCVEKIPPWQGKIWEWPGNEATQTVLCKAPLYYLVSLYYIHTQHEQTSPFIYNPASVVQNKLKFFVLAHVHKLHHLHADEITQKQFERW